MEIFSGKTSLKILVREKIFRSPKLCARSPPLPAKILLNLLNSCIKLLLSDGSYKTYLMKSRSRQTLSSILRLIILLSFDLTNFVNLSTTFFIQRLLTFLLFHKIRVFNVSYCWDQRFFTSMSWMISDNYYIVN